MDKFLRALPPFKGKERLARLLLTGAVKNKTDVQVMGKYNCIYLLPNILENVGFDIFINGEYEPGIQELIYKLLPIKGCFLDLGANIGSIVVPAAKRRPDIQAVAVEAAPWIFTYLQKNISINGLENVKAVSYALFDSDDKELSFFSPRDKFGKGSLSPVFTQQEVKVKSKRLDTLVQELDLKKVDLIKIDVEGFEYYVFKGAEKLLKTLDAPIIIFEFVDWAEKQAKGLAPGSAQRLLMEMGYLLYQVHGSEITKIETCLTSGASNLIASKKELNFQQ